MNNILETLPQCEWDKLISSILKPFISFKTLDTLISIDDLTQEAWVALLHAAQNFDATRNTKFTTFAYLYIRGRVLRYIQYKTRLNNQRENLDNGLDISIEDPPCVENQDILEKIMSLTEGQKHTDLLIDYVVNEKSFRKIAAERGLSHQCVALRVKKLLNTLKIKLDDENS